MTSTPWGDATKLRARRLRPGPGADPAAVTRNQRERMHAAMVAAVAENGYEATRVADVVKLSGVSRSAFYKHFEDKLDCFLATLEEIAKMAQAELQKRYDTELPWEERLRTVADGFLDLLLEQPAAARFCLVEVYAAGEPAVERLDQAVRAVEDIVGTAFGESPERKGMPRDIVRAIVGGIRKTIHTRVRRGDHADLIEQLPSLIDWGLGYEAPPEKLKRPRRKPDRGAAPVTDTELPRERLITAITGTIADRGYADATIIEIAERASASLSTFYANFENKEEALLAALEREREQSVAAATAAVEAAPTWEDGVREGLDALFGFLAAEPAAASVAIVDAFTAGTEGLAGGDQTIWAFHPFLEGGQELEPSAGPLVSEAIGNAVYSLAYGHIRDDRGDRMRELTPIATFIALAPFTGAATACAVANG
jgi:AcrR family transcriptional regulator